MNVSGETSGVPERELEIDVEKTIRYSRWVFLVVSLVMIPFFAIGLIMLLFFCWWLPAAKVRVLRYRLSGTTLHVDEGVIFKTQKRIPLDRVTDFAMVEGPLMRRCGIKALRIQTAGQGNQMAEATLYGLVDPEGVRDLLVKARDVAARGSSAP